MQNHYILNFQPNLKSIFRLSLLLCLLNCSFNKETIAQSTPKGATISSTPDTSKKGNTWAVIVGISKYQNVQGLNYADKDALAFYDYLVNKKGLDRDHIQLLVNEKAIASNIYQALDLLTLSIKENDRVIFYFSGHGDVETKTIYQNGFLLAYDAPVAVYMAKGAIGITYLQQYLETFVAKKAKDVLLIVDACRSGKLAGGSEGIQITMHSLGQTWNNQIIKVLSAQEGESSFEDKKWGGGRGVFSYYLVKGLEGLANRNADSVITTAELATYLPFAVADATGSVQNPTVSGNLRTSLFSFNKDLLALANSQENQSLTGQILAARGTMDELDPEIAGWYNQYRTYLQKGRLIWGEKQTDTINCAKFYYLKLVKDDRAKSLLASLKSSFVAFLKHKAEEFLDNYIKDKFDKNLDKEEVYSELIYAKSLIANTSILYNYLLARIYFIEAIKKIDLKDKIKVLMKVIQLEPDASYAYHQLGLNYEILDNTDSAIYYYKKALNISPTWSGSLNELGNYLNSKKNYKDAIFYLEKGLKLDSSNFLLYTNLASAYGNLYRSQKKIDSILNIGVNVNTALIKEDSIKTRPYINLANLLSNLGNHKDALKYLTIAYKIDSKTLNCAHMLANEYDFLGNFVESIKYYKKEIQIYPDEDFLYTNLGLEYEKVKNYNEAIRNFKIGIKLSPLSNYNYTCLSKAYLLNKDYKNALKISLVALKNHPEKVECYEQLGNVYLQMRDLKKANLNFNKSIIIDPENSGNIYNIACLYSLNKNLNKSLYFLELSIQKGFRYYNWINKDSDLIFIRQSAQFKELMKKYFPDKIK